MNDAQAQIPARSDPMLDNARLLAGFRAGERWAFEEIFRLYVDIVATVVRRGFVQRGEKASFVLGLSDTEAQDDVIQETFLRAFSPVARQNYNGETPFRWYLLRIGKNLMVDRLRKRKHEISTSEMGSNRGVGDLDAILDHHLPFEPEDPAEQGHRGQQQEATRQWVETLPEAEKRFYDLRYRQGDSQEKVAGALSLTRRKIRTLEDRLCKGLKKQLKKLKLWP